MSAQNAEPVGAVLVCGGGIAGIQASLDLSAAGFRVYLVEETASIGGSMARLDKTFPTGDCATCIISPKLVECMRDHNIDVLTMADVEKLDGEAGNFEVAIRRRPRSVDADKCTGCGDCWQACPVRNVPEQTEPFSPSRALAADEASALDEIVTRHQGRPGALMPVLQEINQGYGHLPRVLLEHVSVRLSIPLPEIVRVAGFYTEFRLEPVGRHIVEVCNGTSCYARASGSLLRRLEETLGIRAGETATDGRFTLKTVNCLGLCALSPTLRIDGRSFGRVQPDRLAGLLEEYE